MEGETSYYHQPLSSSNVSGASHPRASDPLTEPEDDHQQKVHLGAFWLFSQIAILEKQNQTKHKKEKYMQKNCRRISRLLEAINLS